MVPLPKLKIDALYTHKCDNGDILVMRRVGAAGENDVAGDEILATFPVSERAEYLSSLFLLSVKADLQISVTNVVNKATALVRLISVHLQANKTQDAIGAATEVMMMFAQEVEKRRQEVLDCQNELSVMRRKLQEAEHGKAQ